MLEPQIRVMLIDDHPMVQDGLIACFSYYDDIEVVACCNDGATALAEAQLCRPDVILMDISMPGMNGIEATEIITEQLKDTKVLIFSMHDNAEFVTSAIQAGASGYILKNTSSTEVYQAIKEISLGKPYFSSALAKVLATNPVQNKNERLTNREQVILSHIARGKSSKEVASILDISSRTVEAHRRNIKAKLHLDSLAELVRYAVDHGLIDMDLE